jgi:hypothetical protein
MLSAACIAGRASAAILVSQTPKTLCVGRAGGGFFLEMSLNEGWHNNPLVKGRIRVTSPEGKRVVSYLRNFSKGQFSVHYVPHAVGRYRVAYEWFIPRAYLLHQPLTDNARAYYRVERWQTAARWFTRVHACK